MKISICFQIKLAFCFIKNLVEKNFNRKIGIFFLKIAVFRKKLLEKIAFLKNDLFFRKIWF